MFPFISGEELVVVLQISKLVDVKKKSGSDLEVVGLHALAEELDLAGLRVRSDHLHVGLDVALLGRQRRRGAQRQRHVAAAELAAHLDAGRRGRGRGRRRAGGVVVDDAALLLAEVERRPVCRSPSAGVSFLSRRLAPHLLASLITRFTFTLSYLTTET